MNAVHWRDVDAIETSNGLLNRVMMCKDGDISVLTGALPCLKHLFRFSYRTFKPGITRIKHVEPRLQESWFMTEGKGVLTIHQNQFDINPGQGFVVQSNAEWELEIDPSTRPVFYVSSELSDDDRDEAESPEFSVADFRSSTPSMAHWHHRGFSVHDHTSSLKTVESVAVIEMLPMKPSEPHTHDTQFDEIWCMWQGQGVHVVDGELCVQEPGLAVCVTPNELGHNLINHTELPLLCYYLRTRSSNFI